MKYLSVFSPAEILLILNGPAVSMKSLLKHTFLDLQIREILQSIEVTRQHSPNDKATSHQYMIKGRNYDLEPVRLHEEVFTRIFNRPDDIQVLFRNYVRMVHQNILGPLTYKKKIRHNLIDEQLMSKGFFARLFRVDKQKNKLLKTGIQKEMSEFLPGFVHDMEFNPQKAIEALKMVKGNIFLFDLDLTGLLSMIKEFPEYETTMFTTENESGYLWQDIAWNIELFDSSCSSGCGNSSGGCSGHSGCSGCGGCGGGGD